MKNTTNTIRTICEIGIFAALGFIFDEIQGIIWGGVFPLGGSIGFAMIAVLIIAYRRGVFPALLTGLLMGLFDIATKVYIYHPMQVFLDYIFPYMFVGLAGLLKPMFDRAQTKQSKIMWLLLGALMGGLLKLLSHYLSGAIFFSDPEGFAWKFTKNAFLYSFIYNFAFTGPSIAITGVLLIIVYLTAPRILSDRAFVESEENNDGKIVPAVASTSLIAGGSFLFIFFLIKWIRSFSLKTKVDYTKYSFDQDSMVIYVLGIFFIVLGIICLISYLKKRFNYLVLSSALLVATFISFAYSIVKIVETMQDKGDPKMYWIWFAIALIGYAGAITFFVFTLINRRNKED